MSQQILSGTITSNGRYTLKLNGFFLGSQFFFQVENEDHNMSEDDFTLINEPEEDYNLGM